MDQSIRLEDGSNAVRRDAYFDLILVRVTVQVSASQIVPK